MNKTVPICSIIGHVDVGKTKLLDLMRSSSTEEASGITQQIGATLYNSDRLKNLSGILGQHINVDGLLMIDTPGHECFTAIRYVGMMVSDIVIILVDVNKGLQTETIRCLDYLKKNNKTIIFVVNKIDRLYGWYKDDKLKFSPIKKMLKKQEKGALDYLDTKLNEIKVQLAMQELNAELYYKNSDPKTFMHIVPISAETGEGVPDLVALISKVHKTENDTTNMYGYILDEREDSKHGKYYVCIHRYGTIKRKDTIKLNGGNYTVKRLLMTPDQKEIKDSHRFQFTEELNEPCGFGLIVEENSSFEPGTVYSNNSTDVKVYETDDLRPYMSDCGLTVVAPSRILMDALVKTFDKEKVKMALIHVGKLDKPTLIKSGKWLDVPKDDFGKQYYVRHNTVLWFDPSNLTEKIDSVINKYATENKVNIIVANTIYKLITKYTEFITLLNSNMTEKYPGVFNDVSLSIIPKYIFLRKSPLLFGVKIDKGILHKGDNLIANGKALGQVVGIQRDKDDVGIANSGEEVCIKLNNPDKLEFDVDFTVDHNITNIVNDADMFTRSTYDISL